MFLNIKPNFLLSNEAYGKNGKHKLFPFFLIFFKCTPSMCSRMKIVYIVRKEVSWLSESRYSAQNLSSPSINRQDHDGNNSADCRCEKPFEHVHFGSVLWRLKLLKSTSMFLQPQPRTFWPCYFVLTHNWKLTFLSKLASDWWLVVIVVLMICQLGIRSRR